MALDLWICNHFQVLPTDERFKTLTDRQKILLFQGYLETPTSEQIHESHVMQMKQEEIWNEQREMELKRLGYKPEQIERIKDNYRKAGMI